MLIFLDTEFSDFLLSDLISIALVSEDGREFYAERTDYNRNACSSFVHDTVIPLLGRVPGAACERPELSKRLHAWFDALPEPATVVFDYSDDAVLLDKAFGGRPPPNAVQRLHLDTSTITHPVFEDASNAIYTDDWPAHHARA